MIRLIRLKPMTAVFATALAIPLMTSGCDEVTKAQEGLCCSDFKVGADLSGADFGVDASIAGQFKAFAQASSDLSAVASGSLNDVLVSCRNIALDLGASKEGVAAAEAKNGKAAVEAWCALAKGQITTQFGASGKLGGALKVEFTPPSCSASFEAKANCEASCTGSAKCDFKANPPTCTGGKLSVECSGSCSAEGGASVACTGECSAECKGTCRAKGGVSVACQGTCEGTCKADAAGGTNNGIQADGTCKGTCEGTCRMNAEAPAVKCDGVCEGTCTASCKAAADFKAKCDGKCDGEISAPKCEGGELSGGCTVNAECKGSCDASAKAKAECKPPAIAITTTASASLEANLPRLLLVLKARGQAFVTSIEAVGKIGVSLDAGKLGAEGVACGVTIGAVIIEATGNMKAAVDASVSVMGSAGVQ